MKRRDDATGREEGEEIGLLPPVKCVAISLNDSSPYPGSPPPER